jgi:succinate dehydrogenase/fumarate reductase flavoprotein subunit
VSDVSADSDVVVVGAGPAGLSAAIAAAQRGRSVVVVEASSELGGNGAFATGNLALSSTALQRRRGISDSPAGFVDDMERELARQKDRFDLEFDREIAELYARESADTYAFLEDLGFRFSGIVSRPKQHTADRLTALQDPGQFRVVMPDALRRLGAEIRLRTRAVDLMMDRGRVVGVRADSAHGPQELRTRRVVVASGGYAGSPALRLRHRPDQDPTTTYPGIPTARGDGHTMIERAGAELVNMHMIVPIVRATARLLQGCIAINDAGVRFHDETGHHDDRLRALGAQPGGIGYFLCDARTAANDARFIADVPSPPRTYGSLSQVARAIGAEPAIVQATVDRWNAVVRSGVDQEFGRLVMPEPRWGIEEPPFTVLPIVTGVASTVGGARVDSSMRVLATSGEPVEGLHAAGDMIGLINPVTALGGIHLGSAVTSGRLAGTAASA